jgi:hypothetical protein
MSLPGGNEDINRAAYKTPDELMQRVKTIQKGMTEAQVLSILDRPQKDLTRLQRNEILIALYGSSAVEFRDGKIGQDAQSIFLQSLYGYSLKFKNIEKDIGFTSPFRIRTDQTGYDYTIVLIYQGGLLFETPIVTGGEINQSSSKTLFDYLTPSAIMDYAK